MYICAYLHSDTDQLICTLVYMCIHAYMALSERFPVRITIHFGTKYSSNTVMSMSVYRKGANDFRVLSCKVLLTHTCSEVL